MDARIDLEYIVENKEYVSKLGSALDTQNVTVKKQVFELLSALCAYNAEGYARAIETLEFFKNLKKERYRFQIVINELEKATSTEYQVALLGFINCVIISAANLRDRIRIRNEFIGLRILPVLGALRKVAQGVGDIVVQLDVFEEQRECDEAQSLQGPNGINLNSHLDVFYAILRQVADTPQEVQFLSILQHLLRIEPKESISDVIWDTAEKLVHRATLLESPEDSVRLLRTSNVQKFTCPHCRGDATSPSRKPSSIVQNNGHGGGPLSPIPIKTSTSSSTLASTKMVSPPPPPPPPPPISALTCDSKSNNSSPVPPPPPPPLIFGNGAPAPPPPPVPPSLSSFSGNGFVPPPPAPSNLFAPIGHNAFRNISTEFSSLPDLNTVRLPQQEIPAPKSKMKTLNWGKIPPNKVIGKQNIWSIVASEHQDSPMPDIDWNEMEGLFCLQTNGTQGSPKLGRAGSYDTTDRKAKKEATEITLLDGKRSLNVNIFLKQFRSSNEAIMDLIRKGEHNDFGAEKLRGLLKLLPEVDELDLLKSFNGDKNRLGNAEKFLLQLLEVSNYKLRIESMLLKSEFGANIQYLDPCINAMIFAGEDLINNKMLQEVLYVVLVAGNFLNAGGYAGNAAGVKLSSLQKLTDIRANKPGMNLIHFVAMQVAKRNPELLSFPTQLSALESATKTSSEQITNEINTLDSRIRIIKQQVDLPTTDNDIKQQMQEFLQNAEREIHVLKNGMKEVESMRLKLAEFFCEDPTGFKLEECYKIFATFCEKFKRAVTENERRSEQEAQATLRRKQREEQLAKKAKQAGTPSSDIENSFLLDPSFDPRASPALARRRMGSMNNGIDQSNGFIRNECMEGMSPDITPNGSLRRRRSRVLAEEDELMEFLRSSIGHDHISRERKAYGSLDRSWARRNRSSSSSRKRPDLLNLDFGNERERATSPAPLASQEKPSPMTPQSGGGDVTTPQSSTHEDVKPRISREWRQKIETWLQSNENDEKQNEEYKRKRRLINSSRRSLENDNENERKLHTLEEEKTMPTGSAHSTSVATSSPGSGGSAISTSANGTNNKSLNNTDNYKRVYPDWKPSKTLEQTDIVGTLQAIAEVNNANAHHDQHKQQQQQQHEQQRGTNNRVHKILDKSDNCGSNKNISLEPISEEEKRKRLIHELAEMDANEKIQIYITRPRKSEDKDVLKNSNSDIPKTITPSNSCSSFAMNSNKNISIAPLTKTASYTKVTQDSSMNPTTTLSSPNNTNFSNPLSVSKSISNTNLFNDKTNPIPNKNTNTNTNTNTNANIKSDKNSQNDDTFANLLDHHKSHNEHYSRKEIDADNIETPPVSRRIITSPTSTLIKVNITNNENQKQQGQDFEDDDELPPSQIIPGTFDRHSLVRKTRRYKRNNDGSSGNEDGNNSSGNIPRDLAKAQSPLLDQVGRKSYTNLKTNNNNNSSVCNQNDLKHSSSAKGKLDSSSQKALQKVEKLGRHISSINQEDVREAIRNLKSPTGTPDRIWSPPRDVITHQPTRENVNILNGLIGTTSAANKLSTHDLNDEGFEETQSLVSDSASAHGKGESTTSSCNEGLETTVPKPLSSSLAKHQTLSSGVVNINRTPRSTIKLTPTTLRSKSQAPQMNSMSNMTAAERRSTSTTRPLPRTNKESQSFRHATSTASLALHNNNNNNNLINNNNAIRRSESARKVNEKPQKTVPSNVKRNMDLTSSRNSLSSRSSINSGASTNTVVRRTPIIVTKSSGVDSSASSSPSKRPLTMQNSRIKSTVPASRSSSSSSSVGPNIIVIRHQQQQPTSLSQSRPSSATTTSQPKSSNHSGSYTNENQSIQNKKSRSNTNRSAILVKAAIANIGRNGKPETLLSSQGSMNSGSIPLTHNSEQRPKVHSSASKGLSSFMRPTASSATKRNKV